MERSHTGKWGTFTLCGLLLGTAGCVGGGAEVRSEVSTTTVGQQLVKVLASGVMIEQEDYKKEQQRVLERK